MGGDKREALPGRVSLIISVFLDECRNIGFRGKTICLRKVFTEKMAILLTVKMERGWRNA